MNPAVSGLVRSGLVEKFLDYYYFLENVKSCRKISRFPFHLLEFCFIENDEKHIHLYIIIGAIGLLVLNIVIILIIVILKR